LIKNPKALEELTNKNTLNAADESLKIKTKENIEQFYKIQYEGSRIRSRISKTDDEKPTKSFYNTEANNATQRQ